MPRCQAGRFRGSGLKLALEKLPHLVTSKSDACNMHASERNLLREHRSWVSYLRQLRLPIIYGSFATRRISLGQARFEEGRTPRWSLARRCSRHPSEMGGASVHNAGLGQVHAR